MDVQLEQRVNINLFVKLGKTAIKTLQLLCDAYGHESLSRRDSYQVRSRWMVTQDQSGPRVHEMKTNVVCIRDVLRENPSVTVGRLANGLNIS